MHLIYIDESGNTGHNLNDSQQPVFVLCALVVPEHNWQPMESDLIMALDKHLPTRPDGFEMHANDLRNGHGNFSGLSVSDRTALRDSWLKLVPKHQCGLIYRAIVKKRFQKWLNSKFGTGGIVINPYVAAFALVAQVINDYLRAQPDQPRGMFISDENKQIVSDVEKSIRVLRDAESSLRLTQIVEKGFFIDSKASYPLQLCDLCALSLRKMEEMNNGAPMKSVDQSAVEIIKPCVYRGDERYLDVVSWLAGQKKKERPGN